MGQETQVVPMVGQETKNVWDHQLIRPSSNSSSYIDKEDPFPLTLPLFLSPSLINTHSYLCSFKDLKDTEI